MSDLPSHHIHPSLYPIMPSNNLEKRLLHKALMAFNTPAAWPGWLIGCVAFLLIAGVAGLWWFMIGARESLYLTTVLAVFMSADALILIGLRHWRFSFGPVGPQLFILGVPRLVVAMLAIPIAAWLGPVPTTIGVVVINMAASLALVWGAFVEPQRLGLSNLALSSDSLPGDLAPVRLLHISDLHVERFGRREERLLRMVQAIAPDIIVLTGDYLNLSYIDDPIAHADARRVLAALSSNEAGLAPGGVYAVLGSPPVDRNSASLFDGLPIHLLRDETMTVDLPAPQSGPGNARRLTLVGLDCSHDTLRDAGRLAAVVDQAPPDVFRVLLYHSPELIRVAPEFGIDLYLCGHTHGGQVRLPLYGAVLTSSNLGKQFDKGYYRWQDTHLYVSRGLGMEGLGAPRVRFLCPPEITLISIQGHNRGEYRTSSENVRKSCDKTPDVW
jgi:predicted MPP superfamily phosphohydrolase